MGFFSWAFNGVCGCVIADIGSCSFMAPSRMKSKEDISIAIHRTLVEVYTLKEAGLPIRLKTRRKAPYHSDWGAVGFQQNQNGDVVPIFPNEQTRHKVLRHLTKSMPKNTLIANSIANTTENLKTEKSDENMDEETQISLVQSLSSEREEPGTSNIDTPEDVITPENETDSSPSPLTDKSWLSVPLEDINDKFTVGVKHNRVHCPALTSFRS